MLWLQTKLAAILGGVVAVLGILFAVFLKGKKAAREEIKADTVDKIIEIDKKEREIDQDIRDKPISDIRDGLRRNASDAE